MICIGQFWLLSTEIRLSFVAACFVPTLQQSIYRTGVYRKALCQFLYADALIVSFQNQLSSFVVQHSSHILCLCYTSFCSKVKVLCCIIENCYKCRYGERGAAAARPKAQIILDAAKVSAASGGNSEPKQGQRSQSARGFCPRSTMRVPQPDIIEHFGNADAVPQPPERYLSRKAGIVRCCLRVYLRLGLPCPLTGHWRRKWH